MAARARAREKTKGVAVLELTLSLVFLIPLMLAALDFGYYFYVGATAEEAARQGVLQAVKLGGSCAGAGPVACPAGVAALVTANATTGSGTACAAGGDAACYMNGAPLSMGTATNTTVSCTCSNAPVNPTYTVTVQVDFPAAVGYFAAIMPAGGSPGLVRYRATQTGN